MAKRMTDSDKWKKGFIRGLAPKYKLFWLYILDDCTHAGIWETDFEVASIRIGSKVTEAEAVRVMSSHIVIFDQGNKWFIPSFIDFQYVKLNENSRVHQSVIKSLEKYDVYNIKGINPDDVKGVSLLDKDGMVIKKPVIKRFVEPSVEQIEDYCTERDNRVDSMKFHSYYTSNGWMVGRNKMKDWKGAVRHWESNTPKDKKGRKQLANKDYNKF